MSPDHDKENSDPLPSANTKTVWKSNNSIVLIAALLKEREEGRNLTRDSNRGYLWLARVAEAPH